MAVCVCVRAYLSFDYVIRCVCGYLFCVRAYECGVYDMSAEYVFCSATDGSAIAWAIGFRPELLLVAKNY